MARSKGITGVCPDCKHVGKLVISRLFQQQYCQTCYFRHYWHTRGAAKKHRRKALNILWTDEQKERLKHEYPRLTKPQLLQRFTPHTWLAIKTMASRLGITGRSMRPCPAALDDGSGDPYFIDPLEWHAYLIRKYFPEEEHDAA